ncbi:MAG: hypothetical protein PHH49_01735 [Candidatus Omnitrophica bacterium]|nr:hypothetical protein [Candidatus Omnitrophota bacterium]MDD5487666.1 hypothetical protein [Candidatus Omnitrophota bacterium]
MRNIDKVMLNFSGGYDSLTAATVLAGKAKEVHLVTFRVLTEVFLGLSRSNLAHLEREHPDTKFVHKIVDIRGVQKKLLEKYPENCASFGSEWSPLGMWCCTCQLSMRAASILYCLEHGITVCADGATRAEYHHSSHKVGFINAIRGLYHGYGLEFINPIYDLNVKTRKYLKDKGYRTGFEVFSTKYIQPLCWFTFFSNLRQRVSPAATREGTVAKYVEMMMPVIRGVVEDGIKKRGMDIAAPGGEKRCPADLLEEEYVPSDAEVKTVSRTALCLRMIFAPFYIIFNWLVRRRYLEGRERGEFR